MIHRCTHCGKEFRGKRLTCSRECQRQRWRVGGQMGRVTQDERSRILDPRSTGNARSVMIDGQLQVLDPVALAAARYALRDCWGGIWVPL